MSKTETYRKNQVLCRSAAKRLGKAMTIAATLLLINACTMNKNNHLMIEEVPSFKPFTPPVAFEDALKKADSIVSSLTLDEQIEMIGGHNMFFVKGVEKSNIPQWYLSDATQGVHLRKTLDSQLEKSVAMPCPIMLASTWNRQLAFEYARSVGEECRAGGIAVLLGPGMNIYRISQNGRNFEYFGEDPYLAARMIENYVAGVQSTGTIATLKHFVANNTEFRRRKSNSVVDERTLHEIYLPAFKAGVDAGAMAVMTSYNQVNGEWTAQSDKIINKLLRTEMGFKGLVMSDWWSIWEPDKALASGLDLDMPGHVAQNNPDLVAEGDVYLRTSAKRLIMEGKIKDENIRRMARNIIATSISMGLDQRPVKDSTLLEKFPEHEKIALQTAREGIVLLKNEGNILPLVKPGLRILATGKFLNQLAKGGGSAEVEGYNNILLADALVDQFGKQVVVIDNPSPDQLKNFDIILASIGTSDSEGWDKPFDLPEDENKKIIYYAEHNPNVVVLVNSGGGINMTPWVHLVKGILYGWYPGQNGNIAIAEVLAGKVNPSGKLPITIEKRFSDSPGYPYIPEGETLYKGWGFDMKMKLPVYDVVYDEGVFVGYRWYESKMIEPLFWFGHGLSYTTFKYGKLKISTNKLKKGEKLIVEFPVENTGSVEGDEVVQLYIQEMDAQVQRPVKELKNFIKVSLIPGEKKLIRLSVDEKSLSYYDSGTSLWTLKPGKFNIHIGSASDKIHATALFELVL